MFFFFFLDKHLYLGNQINRVKNCDISFTQRYKTKLRIPCSGHSEWTKFFKCSQHRKYLVFSEHLLAFQWTFTGYIMDIYWQSVSVAGVSPQVGGWSEWTVGAWGLWGMCLVSREPGVGPFSPLCPWPAEIINSPGGHSTPRFNL